MFEKNWKFIKHEKSLILLVNSNFLSYIFYFWRISNLSIPPRKKIPTQIYYSWILISFRIIKVFPTSFVPRTSLHARSRRSTKTKFPRIIHSLSRASTNKTSRSSLFLTADIHSTLDYPCLCKWECPCLHLYRLL